MCEIVNVTYQSDGQSPGGVGKEMVHLVYHVVGIFDIRHLNQIWKRRLIKDGDITKHDFEMENVEWVAENKVLEKLSFKADKKVFENALLVINKLIN